MDDDFYRVTVEAGALTVPLSLFGEGVFALVDGVAGFGAVETVNRVREGAGAGGVFLGARLSTRKLIVPILIRGEGRREVEAAASDLLQLLRAGARLCVTYPDGEVWELGVRYRSGLEGQYLRPKSSSKRWRADVALVAPDPYWRRRRADSFEARMVDDPTIPLLTDFSALPVSEAEIIGDVLVVNPGAAESPVSWVVRGPATGDTTIRVGGRGFTILGPLDESEIVTIDASRPGVPVVTDRLGASRYDLIAPAPRFPRLPAGESIVELVMEGATAGVRTSTGVPEVENHAVNPRFRYDLSGGVAHGAWGHSPIDESSGYAVHSGAGVGGYAWPVPVGTHVSVGFEGYGEGQHAFVFFFQGDRLMSAVYSTDLQVAGCVVPAGCDRVEAGVGFDGPGRFTRSILTLTRLSTSYFDGGSQWCAWTGDADESTSIRYVTELVGGSSITGTFHAGKEVVY